MDPLIIITLGLMTLAAFVAVIRLLRGFAHWLTVDLPALIKRYRHEVIVPDGHIGLYFRNGEFVGELQPGRCVIYGANINVQHVDTRPALLEIAGQEVLTRDQLVIKVSAVADFAVMDAAKAIRQSVNFRQAIYHEVQQALRGAVGAKNLEEVLTSRGALDAELLPAVQEAADALGLKVRAVVIKDFMLAGELKTAYADVIKARMESQAALERARGESAALRNLANAARSFESNPGLYQLRYLQTLDHALQSGYGHTLVISPANGINPDQTAAMAAAKKAG
ncbi:MAG: slipin family protein [Pseudomonadota bacterium]